MIIILFMKEKTKRRREDEEEMKRIEMAQNKFNCASLFSLVF